jgi:colanic acid biosynthesis glycosyl transferase WcaI
MRVLVLGINYAPERVGVAVYTSGLAEALAAAGHEVQVIAGRPYYPGWKIMPEHHPWTFDRRRENGVDVTRVPHYIPRRPTAARRILHHFSFGATSLFPSLWRAVAWRPDLVVTIAPALVAAPVGRLAATLSGAHSWLHLQDFEVEAALATGLMKSGGAARLARSFERSVLNSFHTVSSISPHMCRRLVEKGLHPARVVEFRNWADVDAVVPMSQPSRFREEWGITTPHIALYSGNIANKQGLETLIEAARRLGSRSDLTFVICGEGPNTGELHRRSEGLENVRFFGLQPRERLGELLNLATIHLLPQIAGAADLVLPSKLTNMLASGRPVVAMASPGTGLAREVEGAGLLVPPGDSMALASAIEQLMDDPTLHASLSTAARHRALDRWSSKAILSNIERHFVQSVDLHQSTRSSRTTPPHV